MDLKTIDLETKLLRTKILDQGVSFPEPSPEWEARLEELRKAKMPFQFETHLLEMRVQQVKDLGFHEMSHTQGVKLLMGEPYNDSDLREKECIAYDWMYFHEDGKLDEGEACDWGRAGAAVYRRMEKSGMWFLPPFRAQEKWRVHNVLDSQKLGVRIPPDVIATLNRLKESRVFNTFDYLRSSNDECVLLGELFEIQGSNGRNTTRFFIAKF